MAPASARKLPVTLDNTPTEAFQLTELLLETRKRVSIHNRTLCPLWDLRDL